MGGKQMIRKPGEPNLTSARIIGKPCPKCGHSVRYIKTRSCVWCHKGMINRSKALKRATAGHPYRDKMLNLARIRMIKLRENSEYRKKSNEARAQWHRDNYNKVRDRYITAAREREIVMTARIPPWADRSKIAEIYADARRQGKVVDHEIPLRGISVCGLHVETNLRITSFKENAAKGNKLLEEFI